MNSKSPVILFADRDLLWSIPLRAELRQKGFNVHAVESANEMLTAVETFSPDLVILSDDLDDVGTGVLVSLVRNRSHITLIALLSSKRSSDLKQMSQGLGLIFYGTKPASPDRLLNIIMTSMQARVEDVKQSSLKVMCVDDEPFCLKALDRILSRQGYTVATFSDPERALEAVPQMKPDLIILDILMPGMSGLHLAKEIREVYGSEIPLVMLTASESDSDMIDAYRQGVSSYLTKPYEPKDVVDIVEDLCRK